jgi:formylglycine-generating enzyme required for sulfatase activity
MGDMCISLSEVKPGFKPMLTAVDEKNKKDGRVCNSEMPEVNPEDFAAFVNAIRSVPAISVAAQIAIPEMVSISAGKFKMGSTDGNLDEQPVREVTISAFRLGRYEVTNAEYKAFLEATGREVPDEVSDPAKAKHPVVYVSWNDAVAYCKWLSEKTGRRFRLPTEAEWEYAARGTEGRKYPWGNNWDASKAVFNTHRTKPVGSHPEGASPLGVMDMAGNVLEWVADWYADKYNPQELNNPKGPENGDYRVLRGGSWDDGDPVDLRGALRVSGSPGALGDSLGFRVAEDY